MERRRREAIHSGTNRRTLWRVDDGGEKAVFLSHSGKQKNFVRQLHRDLTREHVSCFFHEDRNSLPLARKFPPLIFRAAEACEVAVVVLSKDFIRSKWPMIELSTFISAINSGRNANFKLLPIFFKISPKELSHITRDSPEWQILDESTRRKWQDDLKEVRSINGMYFTEGENEVDFRDKVVKAICNLLKRINSEFPIHREAPQNQNQNQNEMLLCYSPIVLLWSFASHVIRAGDIINCTVSALPPLRGGYHL